MFSLGFVVISLGQVFSVSGFVFFALDGVLPKLACAVGGLAAFRSGACIRGVV